MDRNNKLKITVDFDKTFTEPNVRDFIKSLIEYGVEVHILTYRYDSAHYYKYGDLYPETVNNHDLWDLCEKYNLHRNVIFTNCRPKSEYLNSVGNIVLHIDDDDRVIDDLRKNSKTIPVDVKKDNWEIEVLNLLGVCGI